MVVCGIYKGWEGKVLQVYCWKWVIYVECIICEKVNGEFYFVVQFFGWQLEVEYGFFGCVYLILQQFSLDVLWVCCMRSGVKVFGWWG